MVLSSQAHFAAYGSYVSSRVRLTALSIYVSTLFDWCPCYAHRQSGSGELEL